MYLRQQRVKETAEKRVAEPSNGSRYPSARYFQIHFEHLYELLADLKKQLDETNAQIAVLKRELNPAPEKPEDIDGL
jgi:hypothetical protein